MPKIGVNAWKIGLGNLELLTSVQIELFTIDIY